MRYYFKFFEHTTRDSGSQASDANGSFGYHGKGLSPEFNRREFSIHNVSLWGSIQYIHNLLITKQT